MGYNSGNSYTPYYSYLCHFGTKKHSGRYPYGSGERPFQREGGRKKLGFGKKKESKKVNPADIKKSFQSKQEKTEFLRKAESATEVLQYRDELTQKELENALNRVNTIEKLRSASQKEIDAAWKSVDDAVKKVGMMKNWAKTGVESVEVVQDIMKILNGQSTSKGNQQGEKKKK